MATKTISPKKKIKGMRVNDMQGFSENIPAVRDAMNKSGYRFHSDYQGSMLIITRTA